MKSFLFVLAGSVLIATGIYLFILGFEPGYNYEEIGGRRGGLAQMAYQERELHPIQLISGISSGIVGLLLLIKGAKGFLKG